MHPDIDDFEDSADETVQWDENTSYVLSRAPDVLSEEEEQLSLSTSPTRPAHPLLLGLGQGNPESGHD